MVIGSATLGFCGFVLALVDVVKGATGTVGDCAAGAMGHGSWLCRATPGGVGLLARAAT